MLLRALAALLMSAACSKDKAIDEPAKLTPLAKPEPARAARVGARASTTRRPSRCASGWGCDRWRHRVYAAGHRGDVVALDLDNGRQLWRAKTRAPLSGGTAASEQLVLVGASDGRLFAFKAMTARPAGRCG